MLSTCLLSQQIPIDLLVAVLERDRLPTIPTLDNVMWKKQSGNSITFTGVRGILPA
jgi:hypothetical protein